MRATASRQSRRGGALILALLFMGVVTVGFATWITVIRQRARVGDLEEHQTRKRIAAANSEIMARDYLLRRVLASNGDPDGLTAVSTTPGSTTASLAVTGSWSVATASSWDGQIQTTTPIWTGYPLDSNTRLQSANGFSPSYDYPYYKSMDFTANYRRLSYRVLTDKTEVSDFTNDTTRWQGFVRSINPLLTGDLLVLHRPTVTATLPSVTGNIEVNGRVLHFAPDIAANSYSARSRRITAPPVYSSGVEVAPTIRPKDLSNNDLIWANLSWTPMSSGNINGANLETASNGRDWRLADLSGQLNFIDTAANPSNSLRAKLIAGTTVTGSIIQANGTSTDKNDPRGLTIVNTGTSPAGTGIATITPVAGDPTPDLPSVIITNDLTEMIIVGQTGTNFTDYAPNRPAFTVLYSQGPTGRNLTTIRLRNQNNRPMVLALEKDQRNPLIDNTVNVIVESDALISNWRLIILAENVPLTFSYAASASPLYQAGTVRMTGGIQTNSPLSFPASPGLFGINPELDTRGLIRMTPRLAWVETFLTGKL